MQTIVRIIQVVDGMTAKKTGVRRRKMKMKKENPKNQETIKYRKDAPGAYSGINTPGIELPAYNPPVPNRAWTAMRRGLDIDALSEEEKRELYLGRDSEF